MFAVSREVDLDDKAGNVLTVTDPIERRSEGEVVEIHSTFNRTHCQEPVVWTEPEQGGTRDMRRLNVDAEVSLVMFSVVLTLAQTHRMSCTATLRSRFLPQTVSELTSRTMNSPFAMPMETISPLGL